jgi:anionic cell wall polymer biosynthesis LytR-Cps2A-Psr (LCP) family protein
VDGYALVDLDAFIELVDLVGGVEFDVPMDMQYADPAQDLYIDLKAGMQTLDGEHAMQLVRYRKGYATQDLERTRVQQQFLKALAKKCLKVVNLAKIGEIAEIFTENVTTDLTVGNIAYFGQELLKCDFDQMYTYTLEGEGVYMDGLSYYAVYLENTLRAVNEYFNPYETEINADHVVILTPDYVRSLQPEEEEPEVNPEELPEELPEDPAEPEFDGEADPEGLPELPTDEWLEVSGTEEMAPEETENN